ncbi:TIGR03621 family F420-dependent LLM class oxidoreductase [Actinosynnema sp. NPDC053489]|uniref:TIGR03621 family F420-dependent LLM class oxidoreductase n=1 Tax=Actinosynnema sp. NPDC053489 TaxID=3363916 RepID=UPI0037CBCD21
MGNLSFGITLATPRTHDELVDVCRTAEGFGFDSVLAVDHLGPSRTSPFSVLNLAARVSPTLGIGTYALNAAFWNSSLLAREVQTAQRMSGGRLVLGIGAGIIKQEFDLAGIPWTPMDGRVAHLNSVLDDLAKLLDAEPDVEHPPVLIGGTGDRVLRLAARRADVVSIGGIRHVKGKATGNFRLIGSEETDERVAFVREAAAGREVTLNAFVQVVEVTDDREAAAARIAADWELTAAEVLDSPYVAIGTAEEIADQVVASHRRYGFTSFNVQRPFLDALGPSIALARAAA